MSLVGLLDSIAADGEEWQEEALCAQTDPEAFFPDKGGSSAPAKKICGNAEQPNCPVREHCLRYALANDMRFGVWGGFSDRERRRIARGVQPAEVHIRKGFAEYAQCGTESGYTRHKRNGEKACRPCLDACNEAQRRRLAARKAS